ncbi:unnamed protein product [Brassica oleracea var. botrytis]
MKNASVTPTNRLEEVMVGGRSNTSGDSRGSSSGPRPSRGAGRFFNVAKKCWCGELMVTLTSNSG